MWAKILRLWLRMTRSAGVGATHTHPSWRSFAGIPLQAVPPDRYEITFDEVPVGTRVSFRVNDQNSCDENPTGAVTRNVLANTGARRLSDVDRLRAETKSHIARRGR